MASRKPPRPWRAPGLPGANKALAPGARPLPMSPTGMRKLLRTLPLFDNTKCVAEMVPYLESKDAARDAVIEELAAQGYGPPSPSTIRIIDIHAEQWFWHRYLSDKAKVAADTEQAKLASFACTIGDASKNNLLAAHKLHAEQTAERRDAIPADPLGMDVPVIEVDEPGEES